MRTDKQTTAKAERGGMKRGGWREKNMEPLAVRRGEALYVGPRVRVTLMREDEGTLPRPTGLARNSNSDALLVVQPVLFSVGLIAKMKQGATFPI